MFEIKAKNIVLSVIKWISTIGVALIVIFAMLVVGVKLLGWDVYVVLSGSMEPSIPTGSIIYKYLYLSGLKMDFQGLDYYVLMGLYITTLLASAFVLENIRRFLLTKPTEQVLA